MDYKQLSMFENAVSYAAFIEEAFWSYTSEGPDWRELLEQPRSRRIAAMFREELSADPRTAIEQLYRMALGFAAGFKTGSGLEAESPWKANSPWTSELPKF